MAKKDKFTNIESLVTVGERQKAVLYKKAQISDEYIKKHILINEELRTLIPPLTATEYQKLAENILKEGCRDPLVLWHNEEIYILVDGHNRYGICTKYSLDFSFVILDFEHINQVKDWMVENQFGKRNITEDTKSYLRGMQYAREKNKVGTNQYSTANTTENIENKEKTLTPLENIASQHKVSTKTIQRDEKYFIGLNKLTGEDEELRWQILQAELPISRTKIIEMLENEPKKEYANDLGELGKKIKAITDIIRQEQRFDLNMLEKNEIQAQEQQTQKEQNSQANNDEKTEEKTEEKLKNPITNEKKFKKLAKNIKLCLRVSLKEQSIEAITKLRSHLDTLEQFIKESSKV